MKITRTSPLTHIPLTLDLDITETQLINYQRGMLIQHAFPNLTPDQREFFLTGYTPEDWKTLFPKEEED